ncbi:MAG TPA: hypothetical protein DDY45_14935 [Verrucomicrobiales bacterium]|nr:hypothetical protein [Verrucomicrobiales bacterium]
MISRELEKRRSFLKLIPNLVSMKIPFAVKSFIVIALLAHLVSCEDSETPEGTTQKKPTTEELAREIEFGPWMSKAGLMFAQEQLPPEDYFAEIEGRVIKGENQYRAITKTLNTDEILSAEAIWGMEAGPLCQYEIARLRKGMERSKSHVFTDTTGKAIHQLIMVLPAGARMEESDSPNVAAVEDEVISTIPEPILESGTPRTPPSGLQTSQIQSAETISEPDPAYSSSDVTDLSTEGVSSGVLEPQPATPLRIPPEPEVLNSPNPVTAAVEETSTEVGAAIGELETPEPVVELANEKPDFEAPPRAVIVEDDEVILEPEEDTEVDPGPTPPAVNGELETATPANFISYKVVRGDTLSGISRRYKVSIAAIKEANGFESDDLRINQVLKVPTQ